LKPALWGAAAGAVEITVIGFSSMGWTLGGTAERVAADRADSAVVAVLPPICVAKFQTTSRLCDEADRIQEGCVLGSARFRREGRLGIGTGNR
jgi:hypothetical protein